MSTPELTVLPQRPSAAPPSPSADHLRAVRRVKQLSWLSLVWMGAEGTVAIVAGVMAGSIALVGFGIDSAIEGFASAVIVWRFTGSRIQSPAAEQRAQKLVAAQFFLLAHIRICCAPTSPARCLWAWPPTPRSGCGGSTRSQRL